MISLILVGKNEGWRLSKCLKSVYKMIDSCPQFIFEVIYVDSKSTDDSIKRAEAFKGIKIFKITGETNSAIARNIGVMESNGEVLFLIDADMEIKSEFLRNALDKNGNLKFNYLTGHLDDYFYTTDGEFIEAAPRTYKMRILPENQELNYNGGLCLINKKIWGQIGGMRNKYKRSQDLDLTIRLKKRGIKIMRIPYLAANHHTIDYRNEKRMWKMLWSGNGFYPGLLFRDHFFNLDVIKRVLRSEYTALLLLIFLITLFLSEFFVLIAAAYILLLGARTILHTKKANSKKNKIAYFFERFVFQIFQDISFWLGFLCFYPQNKELKYKAV